MGLMAFIRRLRNRRTPGEQGLKDLDGDTIRDMVAHSLAETEATHVLVEEARDAHERARDLMRQGLLEEALERFRQSQRAWDDQARLCREQGFKNLWRGQSEAVGREMEAVRITHLDVEDPGSFRYLARRARLRRRHLAHLLALLNRVPEGMSEQELYAAFPSARHDDIRSILFHAQRRGWVIRAGAVDRYRLRLTETAPHLEQEQEKKNE